MKLISKVALLILIGTLIYLLISGSLLSSSPLVIAAQLGAIVLATWARRSFQARQFNIHADPREGPMLLTGPYGYIRHPMYAAALLLTWASILGHAHLANVAAGLLVTSAIAIRIVVEEQLLCAHFPGYSAYAHTTRRIIPFLL